MGGKNDRSDLATTIKFGTRVRHTDGAEGRIVWANASAVKIEWNDGEKVTWRRSELASKGLVVVEDEEEQKAAATETATESEATPVSEPATVPAPAEQTTETASPTSEEPAPCPAPEQPVAEQPAETAAADPTPPAPAKTRRPRTVKADAGSDKKLSAIDAAAKVLGEQGKPMSTKELIGAMAAKGYWTSPGGKTPAGTLYSAMLREIEVKGEAARFVRVGRGMFALRPQA
jgi:preprotein translocase subunit YajC